MVGLWPPAVCCKTASENAHVEEVRLPGNGSSVRLDDTAVKIRNVEQVLAAARKLRPIPGYVNGTSYRLHAQCLGLQPEGEANL